MNTRDHSRAPRPADLDDEQLVSVLEVLRTRDDWTDADVAMTIGFIADLELEVARRRLRLPCGTEPTPPQLAQLHCLRALEHRSYGRAQRFISLLDAAGLWRTYRTVREVEETGWRTVLLERMMIILELRVVGYYAAEQRLLRITAEDGPRDDEREAYYVACIDALFATAITRMGAPW